MTAQPRRREKRLDHLIASSVPIERALLYRAEMLEKRARGILETPDAEAELLTGTVLAGIAQEFRALAEELHWHG